MTKRLLFPLIMLFLFISCSGSINLSGLQSKNQLPPTYTTQVFAMSTADFLLTEYPEKYQVVKTINLYDLLPHLDQLPITQESFEEIMDALEGEAKRENANRAYLTKNADCTAQIGYCQAIIAVKK